MNGSIPQCQSMQQQNTPMISTCPTNLLNQIQYPSQHATLNQPVAMQHQYTPVSLPLPSLQPHPIHQRQHTQEQFHPPQHLQPPQHHTQSQQQQLLPTQNSISSLHHQSSPLHQPNQNLSQNTYLAHVTHVQATNSFPPSQHQHVLPARVIPHENDVLCGRGVNIAHHAGNERFRTLVNTKKEAARSTNIDPLSGTAEKRALAEEIIAHIKNLNPPGRFLKRDVRPGRRSRRNGLSLDLTGTWEVLSDREAIKKTCQALRDCARTDRSGYALGVIAPSDVQELKKREEDEKYTGFEGVGKECKSQVNQGLAQAPSDSAMPFADSTAMHQDSPLNRNSITYNSAAIRFAGSKRVASDSGIYEQVTLPLCPASVLEQQSSSSVTTNASHDSCQGLWPKKFKMEDTSSEEHSSFDVVRGMNAADPDLISSPPRCMSLDQNESCVLKAGDEQFLHLNDINHNSDSLSLDNEDATEFRLLAEDPGSHRHHHEHPHSPTPHHIYHPSNPLTEQFDSEETAAMSSFLNTPPKASILEHHHNSDLHSHVNDHVVGDLQIASATLLKQPQASLLRSYRADDHHIEDIDDDEAGLMRAAVDWPTVSDAITDSDVHFGTARSVDSSFLVKRERHSQIEDTIEGGKNDDLSNSFKEDIGQHGPSDDEDDGVMFDSSIHDDDDQNPFASSPIDDDVASFDDNPDQVDL